MSDADNRSFSNSLVCHLCEKPLADGDKVRNHCHLTRRFLGCNRNFKTPKHIPVFFHNLRGYDAHHLIQGLGEYDKLSCIATTSERFVSVSLSKLRFVDTLQFLNASLETLGENLRASGADFVLTKQCFDEHVELLLRKGRGQLSKWGRSVS